MASNSSHRNARYAIASLAVAGLLAACRASAATATPATATPSPTAVATATPTPWILVGEDTSGEVREAVSAWGDSHGVAVRVETLVGQPQAPPSGLRAVVGNEPEIAAVHGPWSGAEVAFIVLDPASLGPGEKTSVIGPGWRFDQAGFLAGVAAGLATRFGGVGWTPAGGAPAEDFAAGFNEGVRYACPKCRIEPVSDPARPPFAVDVVGVAPGFSLLEAEGPTETPWLIVVGEAAPGSWEPRLAVRLRSAPESLVGQAIERLLKGSRGEAWVYGAENGGLRMEVLDSGAISPGRERLLREAEARLATGMLVVGGGP